MKNCYFHVHQLHKLLPLAFYTLLHRHALEYYYFFLSLFPQFFMAFGGEIITIHLGPYSNYVGANMWNLTYTNMFKTSSEDISSVFSSSTDHYNPVNPYDDKTRAAATSSGNSTHQTLEGALEKARRFFRITSSSSSASSSYDGAVGNTNHIRVSPLAVFCDFGGSIPAPPSSEVLSKVRKLTDSSPVNSSSQSDFAWTGGWSGSIFDTDIPSRNLKPSSSPKPKEDEDDIDLSWYSVLYSFLRPKGRNLQLTPPTHMLPVSCESFAHGRALGACQTSEGDGSTYLEAIEDSIRVLAEHCDSLSGFRLIVDADSAWAGLGALLLQRLCDDYNIPAIVFAASPPLSIHEKSPSSPLPLIFSQHEHSPPAQNERVALLRMAKAPLRSYLALPSCAPHLALAAHLRRITALALLVAATGEMRNVLVVPVSLPWSADISSHLGGVLFGKAGEKALPSNPSTMYSMATTPTLALAIHGALVPIYEGLMTLPQLIATISPRAKLIVASLAHLSTNPLLGGADIKTLPLLFSRAAQAGEGSTKNSETDSRDRLQKKYEIGNEGENQGEAHNPPTAISHPGGLTFFSPFFPPSLTTDDKASQSSNNSSYDGEKESKDKLTATTMVSIFSGVKVVAMITSNQSVKFKTSHNLKEDQIRDRYMAFMNDPVNGGRARFSRYSFAVPIPTGVLLPPKYLTLSMKSEIFWPFKLPEEDEEEAERDLKKEEELAKRVTLAGGASRIPAKEFLGGLESLRVSRSKLPVEIAAISELFTSTQFKTSIRMLCGRLKEAFATSIILQELRQGGMEEDELQENVQFLTILADDYLE